MIDLSSSVMVCVKSGREGLSLSAKYFLSMAIIELLKLIHSIVLSMVPECG
jgi:hypothetical protein